MTKFYMTRDINGYNGFGLPFSTYNYQMKLIGTINQSLTIPSTFSKWIALFQYEPGSSVWVANNTVAQTGTGAIVATLSQFAPPARLVSSGDVLDFATDDASAVVGISLYAIE